MKRFERKLNSAYLTSLLLVDYLTYPVQSLPQKITFQFNQRLFLEAYKRSYTEDIYRMDSHQKPKINR
jgi:hypothetical protein